MKRCSCCRIEKPYTDYHKNRSNKSGYANYCISCKKLTRKTSNKITRFKMFSKTLGKYIVYEFVDINDKSIYIGQSVNFVKRLIQHKKNSAFYSQISKIRCYIMESIPDMTFLEAQLIILNKPKYNKKLIGEEASKNTIQYTAKLIYNIAGEETI